MKFGEKYNIHGYKHNGDLYKVWDETIFLAQTDDYYVFANNKITNYFWRFFYEFFMVINC